MTKENINSIVSGLTKEEELVMDHLIECYNQYLKLKVQHRSEIDDLVRAVHVIQGLLCKRIVRRLFPKYWPVEQ